MPAALGQCAGDVSTPSGAADCTARTSPPAGVISTIDNNHPYTVAELIDIAEHNNPRTRIAWEQAKQKADQELARQNMPRTRQEFGRGDARHDGWNSAPCPKVDNRVGDMSKVGMIRTSSTGGLGPQTSQFNSMRSMSSRTRNAVGNTLTRDGSGQSSWTATPGMATPPSVTSTNSFEYVSSVFNVLIVVSFEMKQNPKTMIISLPRPLESKKSLHPMTKSPMEDIILPPQ